MVSKAEKLRNKRINQGRPRRQGVPRYESGLINYNAIKPETEKQIKATVIDARRRVHGWDKKVPDDTVGSEFAGYTLGRIFLDGNITKEEREAGDEYALTMARYYMLLGSSPSARAQEIFRVSGYSGEVTESYQRAMTRATNAMMFYEGLLLDRKDGPKIKTTVFNVCVMDYEAMREMPDSQLELLRCGLQAIAETMSCTRAAK